MWFLPQGNLYLSGISPICPTGSVELNKYLLGKLLCTVVSYFLGVSTILTLIVIISYYNKCNILLSFCIHYKLNVKRLTVNNCISFLEICTHNGFSTATIATYISAVKAKTTISSHLAALTPHHSFAMGRLHVSFWFGHQGLPLHYFLNSTNLDPGIGQEGNSL